MPINCQLLLDRVAAVLHDCGARGPVVVGVSGGADSVALCRILLALGFDVCVAHLDHAARTDSFADAQWVSEWAVSQGLPVWVKRVPVAPGSGFETRARATRFEFFRDAARHFDSHFVALGHHQQDQAETVLFRLIRGAGPQGLAGIPVSRSLGNGVTLLHPLLGVARFELIGFLQELGQTWREDPSNESLDFARNQIRHAVLPPLMAVNSAAERHIAEAAATLQEEERYWADWFVSCCALYARPLGPDGLEFDRAAFLQLGPAAQARMLRGWCQLLRWPVPARAALLNLCTLAVHGGVADLRGGWRASVVRDAFVLERRALLSQEQPLRNLGSQPTDAWGWAVTASMAPARANTRWRCMLPPEALQGGWVWRSARPSTDLFVAEGQRQSRSLKHWFNRLRIAKHHQRHLLVLAQGNEVNWVVGYGAAGLGHSLATSANGVEMQATAAFQV